MTIRSSSRNHPSCQSRPGVITDYISAERSAGRMSGPWPASDSLHVSPIGLVPKGHDGVTWRMIVDLSYPRGQSVNDCIPSNLCSLSYPSVDDAVDYVMELGRFTQMVKLDLKSAYRILPIHPCDRSVLGVSWEGQVYLDHCLPFGLCSAPKIFTAFADVLAWILHQAGVRHIIHYLDDFLLFGSPLSDEGSRALTTALRTLAELRIPVSLPKLEGPSTTVTFLGIILDSARLELRLPPDKVERIRGLVRSWLGRRSGRRSDLESLLGHLSHAAVVVKPGHIFLRQLFSLLAKVEGRHHFVHLNAVAKADLAWWDCFLQDWHGAAFVIPGDAPSVHVHSDVAGNFGCGAVTSSDRWLQVQWPDSWSEVSIAAKEMAPVVMAAATWGRTWHRCNVFFHCDNAAVVAVIQRKSTRDALLLHACTSTLSFSSFRIVLITSQGCPMLPQMHYQGAICHCFFLFSHRVSPLQCLGR